MAINFHEFRAMLLSARNDLPSVSRETLEVKRHADTLDERQAAQERDVTVRILNNNNFKSAAIGRALARIENGTYGECVECSESISPKRLRAVPWTELCIKCQESTEKRQATEKEDEVAA